MNIKKYCVWLGLGTIVFLFGILAPLPLIASTQKDESINHKEESKGTVLSGLDLYLVRLEGFECAHCGDQFKRVDSNKKFSYGCLQFQLQTFVAMARRYSIASKEESDADIVSNIYDCAYQTRIAKAMFQDNPIKASYHWYTTIYKRGLGLPRIDK